MDVDSAKPGRLERRRELGQQQRIGGEREVAESGYRRQPLDNFDQVGAQCRLAAGKAKLAKADTHGGAHHQLDFGRRQKLVARQEAQAFERHAVNASQIAVVDNRDAQIIDLAVEGIPWHALLETGSAGPL